MRQRQSLRFPVRPPTIPTEEERLSQTIAIAKYLLTEDRCLTPILFFNVEEFGQVVLSGKFENESIIQRPDDGSNEQDPILAVNTLTLLTSPTEAAALIINFDLCNTIAIVGSSEQYYFVDLFHDICYVTKSPEYDIMSYVAEYGESEFKAYYYGLADNVNFKVPSAEAAALSTPKREPTTTESTAPPPPQKKKKVTAPTKKPTTAAAPIETN